MRVHEDIFREGHVYVRVARTDGLSTGCEEVTSLNPKPLRGFCWLPML